MAETTKDQVGSITETPPPTSGKEVAPPAGEPGSCFTICGRIDAHPASSVDDPFRPRWMDIEDPYERQCAHIVDTLGFCGHYIHVNGGGRSGRAPIICALRKRGGEMPQRELMNMFDLKAGSLSEVLTKIERDGFIERTRDPQDRRQLIVRLTEQGEVQAGFEQARRERFRANALACLSADEKAQLEDMLARIKEHWKQLAPDKEECPCNKE